MLCSLQFFMFMGENGRIINIVCWMWQTLVASNNVLSGVALTKKRPHSTILIWVQFLFKPNSPNIFFFTRVSIYIRIGQFFDLSKNRRFWVFQEIPESKNWLFPGIWSHQNQIMAGSWYFKTFKEPPISMKEFPILSWFFDCLNLSFGLTPAGGGFTKWELLVIFLSIYLVWKSQFVVRSKKTASWRSNTAEDPTIGSLQSLRKDWQAELVFN